MVLDIREYLRLIERVGSKERRPTVARPPKSGDAIREFRAVLRLAKAFLGNRLPSRNDGEPEIWKLWKDPLHAHHR